MIWTEIVRVTFSLEEYDFMEKFEKGMKNFHKVSEDTTGTTYESRTVRVCTLNKGKETEVKKTCYNCKHGAYGFDSDLGCNLWHHGKFDAENCQFYEGAK
ncbi:MAG: hypothetical protein K6C34_00950 [Alphaproteobacteria bacterium]|nr:hypothetical protein [Alphaproteobacteria bacterium]